MEKYCKSCEKVFDDLNYKFCPFCGGELDTRYGRQPIPRKLRHEVFKRDGYRCRECGASKDETSLEIDHITPVARGGTNDIDNLQTLCRECNRMKHTDEWVGGETDLEVAENELSALEKQLLEAKEKLKLANNEDDEIEYKFEVKKLTDDMDDVKSKIDKINKKSETESLKKQLAKNKDKALKILYVELDNNSIEKISKRFNVYNDKYRALKCLIDNVVEDLIFQELYKQNDVDLDYFEKHKILFNDSILYNPFFNGPNTCEDYFNTVKEYISKEDFLTEMNKVKERYEKPSSYTEVTFAKEAAHNIISKKWDELNFKRNIIVPINNLEPGMENISTIGRLSSIPDFNRAGPRAIELTDNSVYKTFVRIYPDEKHFFNDINVGDFVKISNISSISEFNDEFSMGNTYITGFHKTINKIDFDYIPDYETIKNKSISKIENLSI